MQQFMHMIEALAGLIVAVALVSVIVSKNANTTGVIQASASGFANNLAVAEAPVTGTQVHPVLSYPSETPWENSPYIG